MPICKLCGLTAPKLADAHLLPKAMTRFLAGHENVVLSIGIEGRPSVRKGLGGLHRNDLICPECEASFKLADNHFISFWKSLVSGTSKPTFPFSTLSVREYEEIDPSLIHQFVCTTLVRAHFSGEAAVTGFSLDDWGERLLSAARDRASTISVGPDIALWFVKSKRAAYTMLPYIVTANDGSVYFDFVFPHLRVSIGRGRAGLPNFLEPYILRAGQTVRLRHSNFMAPNELKPIDEILAPNQASAQRLTEVLSRRNATRAWKTYPQKTKC